MSPLVRVFWFSLFALVTLASTLADSFETAEEQVAAVLRTYRIQTYRDYRNNRIDYDRRISIGQAVVDDWRKRGADPNEIELLIRWFSEAQRSVQISPYEPPTRPIFLAKAAQPGQPADQSTPQLAVAPRLPDHFSIPSPRQLADSVEATSFTEIRSWPAPRIRPPQQSVELDQPAPATSIAPAVTATTPVVQTVPPPIDVKVLDAKIRAINLSLQGLETELHVQRLWTLNELEAAAALIEQRLSDQQLVETYRGVLPTELASQVEPNFDVKPVLALLAQRTFELKIELTGVTSTSLDQLERLHRIAEQIQGWSQSRKY